MAQLKLSKAKENILQELKKIERTELLIVEDFGLQPLDSTARNLLMGIKKTGMESNRLSSLHRYP